jgi:cytochrome c-type biogenesis protein CcmH
MALDRKWTYRIVGLAVAAVAITVAGLYVTMSSQVGSGHPDGAPSSAAMPGAGGASGAPKPAVSSIDVAAERLEKRLKSSDGSADDWALLARSYVMMRRYPEAVDAFAAALKKSPGNQAYLDEQAAARKAGLGEATPK